MKTNSGIGTERSADKRQLFMDGAISHIELKGNEIR